MMTNDVANLQRCEPSILRSRFPLKVPCPCAFDTPLPWSYLERSLGTAQTSGEGPVLL